MSICIHASFNPRTHEGCDFLEVQKRSLEDLSIHAPTRGATTKNSCESIFTDSFNPRTHEGCDDTGEYEYKEIDLSIHAPTRGATYIFQWNVNQRRAFNPRTHEGCDRHPIFPYYLLTTFNPRTHEGCDNGSMMQEIPYWVFQSTHPRGVRQLFVYISLHKPAFQSTHPRGVRHHEKTVYNVKINLSIHAPTRGATQNYTFVIHTSCLSIHAPTRGATEAVTEAWQKTVAFNPRTHEGCDGGWYRLQRHPEAFQSTHPRGVRRRYPAYGERRNPFQSTHPRGVRPP